MVINTCAWQFSYTEICICDQLVRGTFDIVSPRIAKHEGNVSPCTPRYWRPWFYSKICKIYEKSSMLVSEQRCVLFFDNLIYFQISWPWKSKSTFAHCCFYDFNNYSLACWFWLISLKCQFAIVWMCLCDQTMTWMFLSYILQIFE